jgi:Ca-activated chloride channel family protein
MQKLLLTLPILCGLLAAGPAASAQVQPTPRHLAAHVAATRTIRGRVLDAYGQRLPGVTVLLKGTNIGTATDTAGRYTLPGVPPRGAVLVFSFVGYVTRERAVPAKGIVLNLVLEPSQKSLNEVIVTGKAVEQQRRDVSYSVSTVSAAPLQGRVAGVAVSKAARKARRAATNSAPAPDLSNLSGEPSGIYQAVVSPAPPLLAYPARPEAGAGDTYAKVQENAFRPVAKEPLSTFSLDVDNASYTNLRRFLNEGQLPPRDAVRVEEMLNYFHYQLPAPPAASPDPVRISAELSARPPVSPHRHPGQKRRNRRPAARQPRVSGRCVGLDDGR